MGQINIPNAREAGLGTVKSNPVNVSQDISAAPIANSNFQSQQLERLGAAGQGLGEVAIKRYEQQKKVADENAGIASYTAAANELNQTLSLGDNAIYSRKGSAALGSYKEGQETMDKIAEKYTQNLQNDRQKAEFYAKYNQHRMSTNEALSRFEAGQRTSYNVETENALVESSINTAALNYNDPNQIENAKKNIKDVTLRNTEGLPQQALDLKLQARLSALDVQVINKLSTTAPYKAAAYFATNKNNLTLKDQETAKNYVKKGAEENFYTLLEKDPVAANDALNKGFYHGILDSEKTLQFRSAITSQVDNMAKRAQTNQYLSTVKNEQQLFDSIVKSNRDDAFGKLYEYGKGFNADAVFVDKVREQLLKSKPPTPGERESAISQLETTFQSFGVKKQHGDYVVNSDTATLPQLVQFNRDVQLARLKGDLTNEMADSYTKRLTPALATAAKKEKGYDDIGLFDGSEDYDRGTQAIQDYVDKNKIRNDSPAKVMMMSRFIELFDKIPKEIKNDPKKLDGEIDNLVKFTIDENAKTQNPSFRTIGVPNASIDNKGNISTIKDGETSAKPTSKIQEDFTIRKGKDGNSYRVYNNGRVESLGQQQSSNQGIGIISDAIASDNVSNTSDILPPNAKPEVKKLGGVVSPTPIPSDVKGVVSEGTINLQERPVTKTTILDEAGIKVIIPLTDESGKSLTEKQAIRQYDRTDRYLGKFSSLEDAKTYANRITKK